MSAIVAFFVASALGMTPGARAASWKIDPAHSSIGFSIRHVFTKVPGQFTKFSGTVNYDPADPAAASVKVEIDPASIDTRVEMRDNDLRSANFFDVAKFPTMSFQSTKVTKGEGNSLTAEGNLTMHGVTKPVTLAVTFLGSGPGMRGQTIGFEATTKLNRKDFGIVWNKTLDNGGMLLGDDVDIALAVEAFVPAETK
jgi:polyisoprenoid-binding protein YceI